MLKCCEKYSNSIDCSDFPSFINAPLGSSEHHGSDLPPNNTGSAIAKFIAIFVELDYGSPSDYSQEL
jgi:hypothetical protein